MKNHFLLYLDILGFSEMVSRPSQVHRLYKIINDLNVHRHPSFKAIVFSDTLLVYNDFDGDNEYAVMFLCEFAQDLLHRVVGREFYFRAFITYGKFYHKRMNNLDAFFGPVLVRAYEIERTIKCTGIFIDDFCNQFNKIFKTRSFAQNCRFVYVTQGLQYLTQFAEKIYPVDGEFLADSGREYGLIWEIYMLKDIYTKMRTHSVPDVRSKFLATWSYYSQEYPELTDALINAGFAPQAVAKLKWTKAEAHYQEELKSNTSTSLGRAKKIH